MSRRMHISIVESAHRIHFLPPQNVPTDGGRRWEERGTVGCAEERFSVVVGREVAQQGRTVLTMEDLGCAVAEYGVNVRRGEFYR